MNARTAGSKAGFAYEVTRSDEEWRERLGPEAFATLREGGTEEPKSSPFWNQEAAGMFHCKGCDLPLYDAHWQRILDIGWVFFQHSERDALLMGTDWPSESRDEKYEVLTRVEVHCRRCGSHHGHIVSINNTVLHCVNGVGMTFKPASA